VQADEYTNATASFRHRGEAQLDARERACDGAGKKWRACGRLSSVIGSAKVSKLEGIVNLTVSVRSSGSRASSMRRRMYASPSTTRGTVNERWLSVELWRQGL
jgi:hypothetical protein